MTTTVADKSFFDAKVKLFQHFGWEKVAIIYEVQSMELFSVGFHLYIYIYIHTHTRVLSCPELISVARVNE